MVMDGQGRVAAGYARPLGDLPQVRRLAPHMRRDCNSLGAEAAARRHSHLLLSSKA